MAFSGGVYTLPGPALASGEIVSSSENNQFRNDVATAFNLTFLRNGTSTATANLPMGGYKLTGLGVATTSGDALSYGQAAVVSNLTDTALTITRVPYVSTGGLLIDSASFTFDGTTLTATGFAGPLTGNVTGNVSGNAGTVTNGVYTTGDQTIGGTKTLSSNPILSAGTANGIAYLNGSKVLTSGSALTFDGTNLGLGTASPGVKLDIVSGNNTSLASVLRVNSNNVAVNTSLAYDGLVGSGQLTVQAGTSSALIFGANATEQMRLTSTGLGIGTSSPSYPLQIVKPNGRVQIEGSSGYGMLFVQGSSGNSAQIQLNSNGGSGRRYAIDSNSAGLFSISDETAGVARLVLDSSGNLGLGVTPSAWTAGKAIDVGGSGSFYGDGLNYLWSVGIAENAYKSATTWKYKATGYSALRYEQLGDNGTHAWYTAPSGTAGSAISFTQAMTLDASGRLGVGTTSPNYPLVVSDGGAKGLEFIPNSDTTVSEILAYNRSGAAYSNMRLRAESHQFYTQTTERMRIDSSGNVGIGTSSPAAKLEVSGSSCIRWATTDASWINAYATNPARNAYIGLATDADSHVWKTGGSERMRIESSGQLKTQVTNGSAVIDTYGCRAWVNFDGTAAGTFAGGSSTVTRNVGTTTCTVTTTTAHGLITGNVVYNTAITGLVAGARTVTVTNSTTFTFTSTESTSIAAATITFAFANIRAAGNVNSVADIGVGNYYINFTTAMPDAYYSVSGSAQGAAGTSISLAAAATSATPLTANSFPIEVNTDTGAALDSATVSVQVFR